MIKMAQICLLFVWTCKATIISILIGKDIFRIDFVVRRQNNFSNTATSHLTLTTPELMTSHKINKKKHFNLQPVGTIHCTAIWTVTIFHSSK